MDYKDAITYLKEHDIRKDDGTFYEFGEVPTTKLTHVKVVGDELFYIYPLKLIYFTIILF